MTDSSAISVTTQLTASEVYWSSVAVTVRQTRKFLWICGVMAMVFGLLVLFASLRPREGTDWYQISQNFKPLMWCLLFPFFLVFVAPWFVVRKFFKDGRNAAGTRFQFSEEGVKIQSSIGTADLNWTAFLRGQETKSCFLLYPTNNIARVIPKRCIASADDIRSLRELFRRHIPQFRCPHH